jgi:hypothetical protein
MTATRIPLLLAALALLAAGCGSATHPATSPARTPALPSLATSDGRWAVLVMGGSAARHNNFWQILTRPTTTGTWRLVTPPGVASNGGLAAAPTGAGSLVAAFRPSQGLSFTPLATTTDTGQHWSPGLLDAPLAASPSALATASGNGHLLALLDGGTVEQSTTGGAHWARLATLTSLARTSAGQRCGVRGMTAVSFSTSGNPVLAGTCTHDGTVGVFARAGGTWQLAGPALPPALAGQPTTVLDLTMVGTTQTAVVTAGTGARAVLLAAWADGGRWTVSAPWPLHGAGVRSVSTAPGGWLGIVMNDNSGVSVTGPGGSWHRLASLPAHSQTLALGAAGRVDALAAAGTTFTDWAQSPGSASWAKAQTLHVPIQYGSSG